MPLPSVGMLTESGSTYQLQGFDAVMRVGLPPALKCNCGTYVVTLSSAESDNELQADSEFFFLAGQSANLLSGKILHAEGN